MENAIHCRALWPACRKHWKPSRLLSNFTAGFTAWNEIICHWKIPLLMQSQCEINGPKQNAMAHMKGAYLPEAACKSLDQKQTDETRAETGCNIESQRHADNCQKAELLW